jgi:hypothetical protein
MWLSLLALGSVVLTRIGITLGVLGTQGVYVSVFELHGCDDCDWHHQESKSEGEERSGLAIMK